MNLVVRPLLVNKLMEYIKAKDKSIEFYRDGKISKEVHMVHMNILEPKIVELNNAIEALGIAFPYNGIDNLYDRLSNTFKPVSSDLDSYKGVPFDEDLTKQDKVDLDKSVKTLQDKLTEEENKQGFVDDLIVKKDDVPFIIHEDDLPF